VEDDPSDIFPAGSYLALLAPYMKNSHFTANTSIMLRCDNPQCVIKYNSKEEWTAAQKGLPPPPEKELPSKLREKGNDAFCNGKYSVAESFYTRALSHPTITDNEKLKCLCNRAEVYLRLGLWESAKNDASEVYRPEQGNEKAMFRLAKALLHLGQPAEALQLVKLIPAKGKNKIVNSFLQDCCRCVEEVKGNYDIAKMRREASATKVVHHADFESHKVNFGSQVAKPGKSSKQSYCGCVAIKDLDEGMLVSASKAIVYYSNALTESVIEKNDFTHQVNDESRIKLTEKLIKLIWKQPSLAKLVYRLSAGGDCVIDNNDDDKVDISRIRNIVAVNSFACQDIINLVVTVERHLISLRDNYKVQRQPENVGLWLRESYFSHSCIPNCMWTVIGDHIFIYTTKPILEGEELCVSYAATDLPFKQKQEQFGSWISPDCGFTCNCNWCATMRLDNDMIETEYELKTSIDKIQLCTMFTSMSDFAAMENLLPYQRRQEMIVALQSKPLHLQHNLMIYLLTIEVVHRCRKNEYVEALRIAENIAKILYASFGMSHRYAQALWQVAGLSMQCGKQDRAEKCLQAIWSKSGLDAFEKEIFLSMTARYSLAWPRHKPSALNERVMMVVAGNVCATKGVGKVKNQKSSTGTTKGN
jgi:tetratricopeptide (TPR) repeat protein